MMLTVIGTRGSTHGVNARRRPVRNTGPRMRNPIFFHQRSTVDRSSSDSPPGPAETVAPVSTGKRRPEPGIDGTVHGDDPGGPAEGGASEVGGGAGVPLGTWTTRMPS